jgi:hypothetical protein
MAEPKEAKAVQLQLEDYQAWLQDPVTVRMRGALRKWREGLCNDWSNGLLHEDSEYKTAVVQARALGEIRLIDKLINTDDLFEEMYSDE